MVKRLAVLIALLSCAPLGAHDFWIEPSAFRPLRGGMLAVALRVGEDFRGDAVVRNSARFEEFVLRDASGARAIAGLENRDPAGFVRFDGSAGAWIGYRSRGTPLTLSRQRFEQFLREEGLEHVARSGGRNALHRERFYRYAKAWIGEPGPGVMQPLGYRLEIVPIENDLVRIVYEGKPLARALVTAVLRDDPSVKVRTRSDPSGVAALPLSRGVWLIKTTHLVRGKDGVWESLWSSMTFEQ